MKLSSKSITAIKMFIDLGEHYEEGFVSLVDIAKRKELSKKFLEQIVPLFKNNNLLICNRGNQGGYKLAKSPNQITLKDIVYLTENNLIESNDGNGSIDSVLNEVDNLLDKYFSNVSLTKLIELEKESYYNNYSI